MNRYTVRGSAEVEAVIATILNDATAALARTLAPESYRCVVLLGGYGRGEGGVVRIGGVERPHNNLDLLIVTRGGVSPDDLKRRADHVLAPIAQRHGIGIDVGAIGEGHLRRSSCLVMWYDMRGGHQTLLGDDTFVPSLERFTAPRIVAFDVLNLLVNRGTLLLINDLILERGTISPGEHQLIVKHAMKAIIGYGDAWLFFRGAYHWSYVEKQRRMRAQADTPQAFRTLYDEAMEFRFEPSYERHADLDLREYMRELRSALEPVHLQCEGVRLARDIRSWCDYLEPAFRHEVFDSLPAPRACARKLLALSRERRPSGLHSTLARLGFRVSGPRAQLSILFPFVCYPSASGCTPAQRLLGARDSSPSSLRRAYLHAWSRVGDLNFGSIARTLGLDLGEAPAPR